MTRQATCAATLAVAVAISLSSASCHGDGPSSGPGSLLDGQVVAGAPHGPEGPVTYTDSTGASVSPTAVVGEVLVLARLGLLDRPGDSQSAIVSSLTGMPGVTLEAALPVAGVYLFQTAPGGEAALIAAASADPHVALATPNEVQTGGACPDSPSATPITTTSNLRAAFACSAVRPGNVRVVAIDFFQNNSVGAATNQCIAHGDEVSCILRDPQENGGDSCNIDIDEGGTQGGTATAMTRDLALAAAITDAQRAAVSPPVMPTMFTVINMSMQAACLGPAPSVFCGARNEWTVNVKCTEEAQGNLLMHIAGIVEAELQLNSNVDNFAIVLSTGNYGVDLTQALIAVKKRYPLGAAHIIPVEATDATNAVACYSNSSSGYDTAQAPGDSMCKGAPARGTSFAAPRITNVLASAIGQYQAMTGRAVQGLDAVSALLTASLDAPAPNRLTPGQIEPGLGGPSSTDDAGAATDGGTCSGGGLLVSTLSCTPLGSAGTASYCLSASEYQAATGNPLPSACASQNATGCLDGMTGTLVKPCCPGLTCRVGSMCGDSTAAVGGTCLP
jgi:hypothetical protein